MTCEVEVNGRLRRVEIDRSAGRLSVSIDGRRSAADVTVINGVWSLILWSDSPDGAPRRSHEVAIAEQASGSGRLTVHVDGRPVSVTIRTQKRRGRGQEPSSAPAGTAAPQQVTAPMPGKVVKLLVRVGETVAARQGVAVVEAMKMENELRAPRAGTVAEVRVVEGMSVEAGAVLAVIE